MSQTLSRVPGMQKQSHANDRLQSVTNAPVVDCGDTGLWPLQSLRGSGEAPESERKGL